MYYDIIEVTRMPEPSLEDSLRGQNWSETEKISESRQAGEQIPSEVTKMTTCQRPLLNTGCGPALDSGKSRLTYYTNYYDVIIHYM